MRLKALIIDDEPLAHEVILGYAKSIPFLEVTGQCFLATEAFALLQTTAVDLIFLDIQMPKLKGLDFLRSLKNPPIVILTTAYEEYALESYDLNVCDYLLKPFRFKRFTLAANKALEWYKLQQIADQSVTLTSSVEEGPTSSIEDKHILIKSNKKHIQLDLGNIYYLESYGNFVKVWKEKEYLLTPRTLSSFESELPPFFIRIHKSYILNRKYLSFWEGNYLQLKNKKQLPVGKSYRKAFRAYMLGD